MIGPVELLRRGHLFAVDAADHFDIALGLAHAGILTPPAAGRIPATRAEESETFVI